MSRPGSQHTRPTELRRPIPYVGDNLDRLLGLLERARLEQEGRARAEREASYRTLATVIAFRPRADARSYA